MTPITESPEWRALEAHYEAVRELFGSDLGDAEPFVRARFIDYLRSAD